jgi:hypothetical protein
MPTNASTRAAIKARGLSSTTAALGCAIAIAACGSSSHPGRSASGGPALAYAECLHTHGVPNFPDPAPGAPVRIPSSINPQAPAFKSAEAACARLMPSGSGSPSASESRRVELLAIARCMRQHGVTSFADPTSSPPSPANGNAIGGNGVYLSVGPPASQQSPAYKSAAAACHLP